MAKRSSLKQINRRYHSHMKAITKGAREKDILDALTNGKNSYLRLDRLESSSFDKSWIEEIEGVIFDLGEIITNPRQNTKVEGNLVPVELARKTNAESVQHLASHTQYVKEIDEYGNVIPSKILSMISDDDIRTYENRFIATFVRRLVLFVEKRYEFVSKFAELHDDEVLYFKNQSIVDGATVEIETKIKISHKSDDEMSVKSNAYVERIKAIRNYVLYYYNSEFMHKLRTEKDVHNPILQTNIIRKNPKYHHCYEVYKFIEKYDQLGVNYKVDENYSLFSSDELKELNRTLFANYITLKGKDRSKNAKVNSKVYKPKILSSLDDESFIYGPLLSGPIEFVRSDEAYQQYLESKLRKDLPLHPTKAEKEYYADEYGAKSEYRQDQKQLADLLKRVEKSVKEFSKKAEKIDKEREQARLALLRQELELIQKEEDELLAKARQELIDASLLHKKQHEEEEERKEREFLASIKPPVLPVEMSHPVSKPVTYEEAVAEIWPQSQKEVKHQYDDGKVKVISYTDALGIKPAPIPVEMSHPRSKPVTYEEAVKQIWPQLKRKGREPKHQRMAAYPEPVYLPPLEPEEVPASDVKEAVVPVEMSHPVSEPVTYDEAVEQIWPQTKNASSIPPKREEVKPIIIEDIKPPVLPVEMSHPASKPVTYDEAVEQIWPQTKNIPAHTFERAAPQPVIIEEEKPVEEPAPVEEPVVNEPAPEPVVEEVPVEEPVEEKVEEPEEEIKPIVLPVEMSHPASKPVTYDEAVEEIWPQAKNDSGHVFEKIEPPQPVMIEEPEEEIKEEPVVEEPALIEEPIEEAPAEEPQPVEEEPVVEEVPVEEPAPVEEAPIEEPIPEPVVEEPAPQPEPVKQAPAKPVKKAAPVLSKSNFAKAKKAPKEKPVKEKQPVHLFRAKIPGRFVVKTYAGYYVSKNKYSVYKNEATIFDDFNEANDIKKQYGGKVVKI